CQAARRSAGRSPARPICSTASRWSATGPCSPRRHRMYRCRAARRGAAAQCRTDAGMSRAASRFSASRSRH
ncbi:MAG: hypothetical protein AVDCRST_MAG75-2004, partial [uncultured Propionibacteriaceae bacterium]